MPPAHTRVMAQPNARMGKANADTPWCADMPQASQRSPTLWAWSAAGDGVAVSLTPLRTWPACCRPVDGAYPSDMARRWLNAMNNDPAHNATWGLYWATQPGPEDVFTLEVRRRHAWEDACMGGVRSASLSWPAGNWSFTGRCSGHVLLCADVARTSCMVHTGFSCDLAGVCHAVAGACSGRGVPCSGRLGPLPVHFSSFFAGCS